MNSVGLQNIRQFPDAGLQVMRILSAIRKMVTGQRLRYLRRFVSTKKKEKRKKNHIWQYAKVEGVQ